MMRQVLSRFRQVLQSRGLRYLFIPLAAIIDLIVVFIVIVQFGAPTDAFRQTVEKAATEAAGMKVSIGALALQLLPEPVLSLSNVIIEDIKDGTPLAVITSGRFSLAVTPLLDERIELSDIDLAGLDLRLSEMAEGEYVHVVHINRITGAATATAQRLDLLDWKAELYAGVMRLDAVLSPLEGAERTLSGKLIAKGIQIQPMLVDASGKKNLSGKFYATLYVATKGETEKLLRSNLKVEGQVLMNRGGIEDIGLEGRAVSLAHGNMSGGTIPYDEMKFHFNMRGKDRWLNKIVIKSPHLDATGHVKIGADKEMRGEIRTSGIGGLAGGTLLVSGTTDYPSISPAPASLIGSVIGGVVGGPVGAGIGSNIGDKIGDVMQGIGKAVTEILDR